MKETRACWSHACFPSSEDVVAGSVQYALKCHERRVNPVALSAVVNMGCTVGTTCGAPSGARVVCEALARSKSLLTCEWETQPAPHEECAEPCRMHCECLS